MSKIVSLMFPTIKCHGEAEKVLGSEVKGNSETKAFPELPNVADDGIVSNMPEQEDEVLYLVNIHVFNALKDKRDDLIAFDDSLATRNEKGWVLSQGGVIFSR